MQRVKITVEVDGEVVDQVVEQVDGTLEQMEEKIDALTRQLAAKTLQASVIAWRYRAPFFAAGGRAATQRVQSENSDWPEWSGDRASSTVSVFGG